MLGVCPELAEFLSLRWPPKICVAAPIGPFAPRRLRRSGAARNCWWVSDDDGHHDRHFLRFPLCSSDDGTGRSVHDIVVGSPSGNNTWARAERAAAGSCPI